jgi:hypothetical protein
MARTAFAFDDAEKILREATDKARALLRAAGVEADEIERGLAEIFNEILEGEDE